MEGLIARLIDRELELNIKGKHWILMEINLDSKLIHSVYPD